MWERLAFYLMLGILILYSVDNERGGLGLSISQATEIYGCYMAFVYFTPFLGGMIADRYLGFRRAVALGGFLMAAGFFSLGVRSLPTFYAGLVLVCVGNGFFKPNISAMVGNLYKPGDPRRDAGFNIFYMGINIGASISALLAAPLRNLWDFNVAFIGAGVGLLIGVSILLFYWKTLASADIRSKPDPEDVGLGKIALVILLPAALFAAIGYFVGDYFDTIRDSIGAVTFAFLVGMVPIVAYFVMLVIKAGPEEKPGLAALLPVYVAGGAFFMILHLSGGLMTFFTEHNTSREGEWVPAFLQESYCQKAMPSYYKNAAQEVPRPTEETLLKVKQNLESMFGAKRISEGGLHQLSQDFPEVRIIDVDTDPDAIPSSWDFLTCKVYPDEQVKVKEEKDAHGVTTVTVSVEPETAQPLRKVVLMQETEGQSFPVLLVTEETFEKTYQKASTSRMARGKFLGLVNAELIVGLINPVFVVLLTPLVMAFFAWRLSRNRGVSTARKIFYGMLITTVSLAIMAWGAYVGEDGESKVSVMWLVYYYLIITVGELCLSPMGLSLVTKLSPKRFVGLMMGGWFLSVAIGNKLSGFISGLPATTLMFLILAGAIFLVAVFLFLLLPRLDTAIKKYGA